MAFRVSKLPLQCPARLPLINDDEPEQGCRKKIDWIETSAPHQSLKRGYRCQPGEDKRASMGHWDISLKDHKKLLDFGNLVAHHAF